MISFGRCFDFKIVPRPIVITLPFGLREDIDYALRWTLEKYPRLDPDLVFQFKNDPFGRFFAEAADFGKGGDVGRDDRCLEVGHAHAAEHGQAEFRSDSADVVDQQAKEIALGRQLSQEIRTIRIYETLEEVAGKL